MMDHQGIHQVTVDKNLPQGRSISVELLETGLYHRSSEKAVELMRVLMALNERM